MQTNDPGVETFMKNQSQSQCFADGTCHDESDRIFAKQEVINASEPSTSRVSLDSTGTRRVLPESSELTRTMSRTEAVKQDVRKLKSMTLDRMGKMFKSRTSTLERSSLGLDNNLTSVNNYGEESSREEKTNSLGRIFKLIDKDGSPKKLFVRPRARSLSRILRRHSHNEDNRVIDKSTEDTRGIFSRMFNQLRGK